MSGQKRPAVLAPNGETSLLEKPSKESSLEREAKIVPTEALVFNRQRKTFEPPHGDRARVLLH